MGKNEKGKFPEFMASDVVGTVPRGHWRVSRPIIDKSLCELCWLCVFYCPEDAVIKGDDGPEVDLRFCKGCGVCANECKLSAITMVEEYKEG